MPRKPSKPKTTRRGKNEGSVYRRTTSLVRSILIQLYDYAVEMSLAPINTARSTKLPRQPQRPESEEKVIPIAQREAVLAAALSEDMTVNLKYL